MRNCVLFKTRYMFRPKSAINGLDIFVCFWRSSPPGATAFTFTRFLDHTQRLTAVDRTPLDEWSAHRRDLYLTAHNTHNRQASMPPGGIRPHNLSRRAAAEPRLRLCGHLDRGNGLYAQTSSSSSSFGTTTLCGFSPSQPGLSKFFYP